MTHLVKKVSIQNKLCSRQIEHNKITSDKEFASLYEFGKTLGQGVFGTVMEVKDKRTKEIWATKIIDKSKAEKQSQKKLIEREIQILKMVNHPHIIHLDKIFESRTKIYLIIEKCNVELASVVNAKKYFTEPEAQKVIECLASAVAYLHKFEIVHRDLKLENILTATNPNDSDDPLYIKLTDFGLSIIKTGSKPGDVLKDKCGTLTYMAPEIIARKAYTHQCDVWAMGVCAFKLLLGRFPFYSPNDNTLMKLICETEPSYKCDHTISYGAKNLLTQMLTKDPALRITAAEVEYHAWVRGENMAERHATENVLDMMREWRSDLMVRSTTTNLNGVAENLSSNGTNSPKTPEVNQAKKIKHIQ